MKPPYEITKRILVLYGQILDALGQCKSLNLAKPEATLRRRNRIKTIHSSLAIEGNTLDIGQVTALVDNVRVLGPRKEILEVQNAIRAYDSLSAFTAGSIRDFLRAHGLLMEGLIEHPGEFRRKQVGILKGKEIQHIAPGYAMVPGLMKDLFGYLKKDDDPGIIKSCVFHYEMEFIHPFEDGNGRIGRLWQTRLLMEVNPIFEYIPIEETIKNSQERYYAVLAESDNAGRSTKFIEFMLEAIEESLRKTIGSAKIPAFDFQKRADSALASLGDWFDRKAYVSVNKGISEATASRDLKRLLLEGRVESSGTGRMTRYRRR